MEILPSEVESVRTIGNLHGDDVKLVKTHGGFHIAIGKKSKTSRKAEALAAGSHQGIVAHQIAKQYTEDFQPAIFKSEGEQLEKCEENTSFLPPKHVDFGLELFTLNKGLNYDLILYKHGITLGKYETEVSGDKLLIKSHDFKTKTPNDDIARAFAAMFDKIMKKHNLKAVESKHL